jgi:hypothetical protein
MSGGKPAFLTSSLFELRFDPSPKGFPPAKNRAVEESQGQEGGFTPLLCTQWIRPVRSPIPELLPLNLLSHLNPCFHSILVNGHVNDFGFRDSHLFGF